MTLKLSLFTVDFYSNLCCNIVNPIFVYADMQNVCRCMQVCMYTFPGLHHLNKYKLPLKLSVNLNLHTAGLPTPAFAHIEKFSQKEKEG